MKTIINGGHFQSFYPIDALYEAEQLLDLFCIGKFLNKNGRQNVVSAFMIC